MIGLDTNVLVRYLVQDEPGQVDAAARLIEGRSTARLPGYVSVPVLVELVWVLAGAYRYERGVVAGGSASSFERSNCWSRTAMQPGLPCGNSRRARQISRTA